MKQLCIYGFVCLATIICGFCSSGYAAVTGRVVCNRLCGLHDLRLTGPIIETDVSGLEALVKLLHQTATAQGKQIELPMMQLNSRGGSVSAAMSIGRLLRQEDIGASVDPDDVCASACVLVIAGAVIRSHAMNLGIHRPYFEVPADKITDADVKQYYASMLSQIRSYLREMNVAEGLADAMLRIPPEEVHFLTFEEADAYGLTLVDPVFQETYDLKRARALGINRQEYVRRNALATRVCLQPRSGSGLGAFKEWTACMSETLRTGNPPAQQSPDFSQYGTPAH